jgi:hypothetical protein
VRKDFRFERMCRLFRRQSTAGQRGRAMSCRTPSVSAKQIDGSTAGLEQPFQSVKEE